MNDPKWKYYFLEKDVLNIGDFSLKKAHILIVQSEWKEGMRELHIVQ